MRKVILSLSFMLITCVGITYAQAVFKKYGFNKAPLTLSNGKYNEFFTNDEVIQIGTVKLNTRTNQIVEFLEEDTTNANYKSEFSSRWLSVDPLAEKYPNYSPYVYCYNNPVVYVDPNGKYGVNIHYVMTYNSLLMLGSNRQKADLIAHYSGTYADHPSQTILDNFNPQPYNQYRAGIDYSKTANSQDENQSIRHSMMSNAEANHMSERGAQSRGLSYGWENIFKAGSENGLSSLGIGLHALHDAFAHKGAKTSDHLGINLSSAGMLFVDQYGNSASNSIGGDAQLITRTAIISYGLLKGDNSYIQNAYNKGLTGLLFEGISKEQFDILSKKANEAGYYFKQYENTNYYSLRLIGE